MSAQRTATTCLACVLAGCQVSPLSHALEDAGALLGDAASDASATHDAGALADAALAMDATPDSAPMTQVDASVETPIPCAASWYETHPEFRGFVAVGDSITIRMTDAPPAQCRMLRVDHAQELDVWIDVPIDSGVYSQVNTLRLRVLDDGGREFISRGSLYCRACGPVGLHGATFEPGIYELGFEFVEEYGDAMPSGEIVFHVEEAEE